LFNLGDFIGSKPDSNGVALIKAMFEDSFKGKPFDFESYGHAYRAYKIRGDERRADADAISHVEKTVEKPVSRVAVEDDAVETRKSVSSSEASAGVSKQSPDEFLRKLKEKHAKKAS
jgi:hypothetical protein